MTADCPGNRGQAVSFSGPKSDLSKAARRYFRHLQWLIISVVFALLAACDGATTHHAVAQKPPVDPDWWLGPMSEAHDHLLDAIYDACPPQGQLSNARCIQEKIVASFAPQNSAVAHCPMDEIGLLLCVDLFTATERIYQALGQDPDGAIDWDDPYESLNSLEDKVAARLTAKCPGSDQDKCVAQEIAAMLPVSANDAGRCVLTPDVGRSVRCVTGLIRLEGYQNALRTLQ